MESLSVVQVTHTFPPYMGGLSHVCEMLSKHLSDLGHEVRVVTLDPSGRLKSIDHLNGVSIRRFPCIAPANAYFLPSAKIVPYLRSLSADVVHVHNIGALLVPATYFAVRRSLAGVTFVVSPHHHEEGSMWHTRLLWKPYGPLARRILHDCDAVHCVSEFEGETVRREFGVDPVVVPNGVAADVHGIVWRPPEHHVVLTYAGRLEAYKRIDVMLKACASIAKHGLKVTARVIGEGPALADLQHLAESIGVQMEACGFLPRDEYLRMLSTSSCFVNPSRYKAFSIVVAEALSIGVPVVASLPWARTFDGYGMLRTVDGESPEQVTEAVLELLKSKRLPPTPLPTWETVAGRIVREVYLAGEGKEPESSKELGGGRT